MSADRNSSEWTNKGALPDMSVEIAGVTLKNPVMTASGTFGSGMEYSEFVDLNHLGAVVTKGVANVPWEGNPTPRVAEVYGGMLNAIGLQNPGIDVFIERDLAFLKQFDTKVIVNVCGHTEEEYLEVVERLADQPVDTSRWICWRSMSPAPMSSRARSSSGRIPSACATSRRRSRELPGSP